MRLMTTWGLTASGLLGWSGTAQAVDKSFSKALSYIEISPTGSEDGSLVLILVASFVLLIAGPIIVYLHRQRHPAPKARAVLPGMKKQAQQLGFKLSEIRVLRQLADRMQINLDLASLKGRMRFVRGIERRIQRKRHELEMLDGLRQRLMEGDTYTVRETTRVEADLAVWLMRKTERDEGESTEEQSGATLVDLSEGGAALRTDLALEVGDVVEWWSADPQIWIPPLTAVVVRVENGVGHLHFADPPTSELRHAMQELERELEPPP